jgi:Ca2+-binding EF-hand superfamily protein
MKRVVDHFQYFDKDRSGVISRDEFPPLYENLKKAGHRLPSIEHFMANIDEDGDGSISLRVCILYIVS